MKYKTTGKSLKELLEEFGTGSSGFYPQEWYRDENFFTEKPESGEWEIDFETNLTNKTYEEQLDKLPEGYKPIHPAILCEIILNHYKNTGKRLLENIYSRTCILDSDGNRVFVGRFDDKGLYVDGWVGGFRVDYIGLSAARKLDTRTLESLEPSESLTLDKAIKVVKDAGYQITKII